MPRFGGIFFIYLQKNIIMKAMIFAAGLGTRLAPLTNDKPKALVEVGGKPMLEMQIENLKSYGVKYIVINIHHFADQIINFIKSKDFGIEIHFSDESDLLLDTGGGLKNVKKYFQKGDNFLVHNVDIYSDINLKDFYNYHITGNNLVTLAVKHRNSTKKLLFDENLQLCGWKSLSDGRKIISIEKPQYDEMAFSGIYVFNYKIFDEITKTGAFPIIPELLEITKTQTIKAWVADNNNILDLGKHEALIQYEKLI
ncbi:MAG: D-glycero-alpha-D-manno-heptose 1-phosphate guanylyltransferase [Bacteroidetes bacterium ADurb.Bin028]|jgi:NDP-sugar pyrophosphorylase family protein|nr:MAG: D-glycero-alpha-D-manno-heptose 1-phosphate guanylyltransferase [Bacteroidetes bacterium ADurb.Bin028]